LKLIVGFILVILLFILFRVARKKNADLREKRANILRRLRREKD